MDLCSNDLEVDSAPEEPVCRTVLMTTTHVRPTPCYRKPISDWNSKSKHDSVSRCHNSAEKFERLDSTESGQSYSSSEILESYDSRFTSESDQNYNSDNQCNSTDSAYHSDLSSASSLSREFRQLNVEDLPTITEKKEINSDYVTPSHAVSQEVLPKQTEKIHKSLSGVEIPQEVVDEIYSQDEDGDTKLHMAIIHGQEEICNEFIHVAPTRYWLDIPNCLLQTPLHLAVITKLHTVIRRLLINGASIAQQDTKGFTPLHIACLQNDPESALQLLNPMEAEEGFKHFQAIPQNLEIRNYEGKTCLHIAAEQKNHAMITLLLKSGANISAEDGKSGRTCLHYAAESGDLDLVKLLVKSNVDQPLGLKINSLTYGGETPMGLAAGHGHLEVVQLLLVNRAELSVNDQLMVLSDSSNGDSEMEEGNR